jgi:hypothetical protein
VERAQTLESCAAGFSQRHHPADDVVDVHAILEVAEAVGFYDRHGKRRQMNGRTLAQYEEKPMGKARKWKVENDIIGRGGPGRLNF